jgi:hypothetical protein
MSTTTSTTQSLYNEKIIDDWVIIDDDIVNAPMCPITDLFPGDDVVVVSYPQHPLANAVGHGGEGGYY